MIEFALLFANPQGTQALDLSTEVRTIRTKLRAEQRSSFLKLHLVRDASPSAIEEALKLRPHLVHFGGHGYRAALGVEGDRNQLHRMPKAALSQWIDVLSKRTRVVLLNACHSIVEAEPLLSAVECVIGMRAPISDRAALEFASCFYSALGDGKSVAEAFASGKAGIASFSLSEEDTPVLKPRDGVRAEDIRLFRPIKTVAVSSDEATDRELALEVKKHLEPSSRIGIFNYASVDAVPIGVTRTQYIEDQLQSAEILLPLLSPELTNDPDLLEGVAESMRRRPQMVVAPIMLRACDIRLTPFAGLQTLPRTGVIDRKRTDREAALVAVSQELSAVATRLLTDWNQREHTRLMALAATMQPAPAEQREGAQTGTGPATAKSVHQVSGTAGPLAAPPGKHPTRPSLRALISKLCRTPADLDLLCTDYFPRLAKECGSGMTSTERVNQLLQRYDEIEIWQKLSKTSEFAEHAHLVVWE